MRFILLNGFSQYNCLCGLSCILAHLGNRTAGDTILHTYEFCVLVFVAKHRDQEMTQETKSKRLTLMQNGVRAAEVVASTLIYHGILVKIGREDAWFDAFTLSIGIWLQYLNF